MSRYWKAALPFLLAAVIILAAASRPVVLHIGFPCDSYWNVPGENYYTFIDAAIEKFEAEHPNVKVEYTSGIRVEDYTEWLSGQYLLGQSVEKGNLFACQFHPEKSSDLGLAILKNFAEIGEED